METETSEASSAVTDSSQASHKFSEESSDTVSSTSGDSLVQKVGRESLSSCTPESAEVEIVPKSPEPALFMFGAATPTNSITISGPFEFGCSSSVQMEHGAFDSADSTVSPSSCTPESAEVEIVPKSPEPALYMFGVATPVTISGPFEFGCSSSVEMEHGALDSADSTVNDFSIINSPAVNGDKGNIYSSNKITIDNGEIINDNKCSSSSGNETNIEKENDERNISLCQQEHECGVMEDSFRNENNQSEANEDAVNDLGLKEVSESHTSDVTETVKEIIEKVDLDEDHRKSVQQCDTTSSDKNSADQKVSVEEDNIMDFSSKNLSSRKEVLNVKRVVPEVQAVEDGFADSNYKNNLETCVDDMDTVEEATNREVFENTSFEEDMDFEVHSDTDSNLSNTESKENTKIEFGGDDNGPTLYVTFENVEVSCFSASADDLLLDFLESLEEKQRLTPTEGVPELGKDDCKLEDDIIINSEERNQTDVDSIIIK